MRPAFGQLGDAPRALDGARGPWNQFFDVSIQKNFRLGESNKRRLQFRVDLLNALNHPIFRPTPNASGGTDLTGNTPTVTALTTADYNSWAIANGKPQALAAGDAGNQLLTQINNMVNAVRVGGTAAGTLPNDFFHIPLPHNFYGTSANSFDITTLQGFRLYRMRQAFNTAFGDLYGSPWSQPRYIQFGLKLYF
jgi:hypothetical protein